MIGDPIDQRAGAILLALALLLGLANVVSQQLHLKALQATEWPTDIYALQNIDRGVAVDVGVVGSSRTHYALPPSALDLCLSEKLGRPTETVAVNRMRASAYTIDISAREVFSHVGAPPVLIAEVAPESLNAYHFELDFSVSANADVEDMPACVSAAFRRGGPEFSSCARPLLRGVENIAFLLHRDWTDHRHIEWMATYHGGGQYCYEDEECLARNAAYDAENRGRWESRVANILPDIAPQRFANYQVGGLPAAHFVAMLARAQRLGQALFVVNLPVHALYQARIPPEDYAAFMDWTRKMVAAYHAHFLDYNVAAWQQDREMFLDPDHLNSKGGRRLSEAVCAEVVRALH